MGPFRLADWIVDPRLGTLRRPGDGSRNPVDPEPDPNKDSRGRLEPKVMGVLLCLAERAGQVVSKRELLDTVWPGTHVQEVALSRSISEIRRRLGDDARQPTFIETLPKRGYRLLVSVEPLDTERQESTPSPERETPADRVEPSADPRGKPAIRLPLHLWGLSWPGLALVILVLTVVLALGLTSRRTAPSVMVVPLQNLGGDPEGEYFAAGLSEDLVTQLWKIEGLKVKILAGLDATPAELATDSNRLEWAKTAGVTTVVGGSVRHEGENLRVAVRLIDVSNNDILWAETYDRGVQDSLVIQQDIARRIAAALVATQYQLGQWDEAGRWQIRRWPTPLEPGEPAAP